MYNQSHLWSPEILFAVEVHHEHVGRLHEFLLDATRRDVDLVFMAYARSAASACHLAHPDVSHHSHLFIYARSLGGYRTQPKL
jgi:hypothetical protein